MRSIDQSAAAEFGQSVKSVTATPAGDEQDTVIAVPEGKAPATM
jgi:hypothetical protein